jgi:uncharacterized membrane protein YkvA (DUF1232 family)
MAMRNAEQRGRGGRADASLLIFARDVILLLKDLVTDPRLSGRQKVVAGLATAYLLSPVDLVPDWLPLVGQLDDLLVFGYAFRRLCGAAGYEMIYEHWRGTDEGLALVLTLAGVEE